MNYIKEVNAFYDWLETNPVSLSSIALWHALMHICNKTGWLQEFAVAVSVLSVKTGLERRTIYNARNELKLKGRINFKERKGNQSAVYSIIWFYDYSDQLSSTKNTHNLSHNGSHNLSLLDLDLNRSSLALNETKTKPNKADPKPSAYSPVKNLLSEYRDLFVAKFNEDPTINWGKDGALLKKLLAANHSKDRISRLLLDFFESEDSFIEQSGYTIGAFYSVFNKLLVARIRKEKEIEKDFGAIDPAEFPGGPQCKCEGRGWYTEFDPLANEGWGRTVVKDCPCRKLKALI